ncbi:very short patch repair endonuclease [Cohnella sp. GbtcB17]|uniref:very short patch repair endonuclease n=1 Tax=Cohnella sp. GbtcB17 TaxID=2824762 RepID=UPI001C2FCDFD|nr:very short patch repair endonuclease [Cohnella sp. GbtcB17]
MTDSLTKEARSKHMKSIKSTKTMMEDKVSHALWNSGLRFRRNTKKLFGKPDISISKYKLVIFIDSCFWHGCNLHGRIPKSNIQYWQDKIRKNIRRDHDVYKYYKDKGWVIERIWEHELIEDFTGVINRLIDTIQTQKKRYYNSDDQY